MNKTLFIAVIAVALILGACATGYMGPRGYVEYSISGDKPVHSVQQTLDEGKSELATSFEDEFAYDKDGNVIKHKQTEIFDRYTKDPKYVIWETEYKTIGGKVVPFQASVNGTVYATIEYDVLDINNDGGIIKDVSKAFYYSLEQVSLLSPPVRFKRDVSLNNYPAPFPADGEFVISYESFHSYYGFSEENVLAVGFNNIVLKSYNLSWSEMLKGMSKSFKYGSRRSAKMAKLAEGQNVDFQYEWKVVAEKACPVKITFKVENDTKVISNMEITMNYNTSGNRVEEEWIVIDHSKSGDPKRVSVFKQELKY